MKHARSLTVGCLLLATIGHPAVSWADPVSAAAENAFGFKLLKQLSLEQTSANISISPYSAATVLQMVENGAAGKTKTEMQQVLEITGLASEEVSAAHKDVAESLKRANDQVVLETADAIWYRSGTQVRPEFIAINRKFYDATVDPLDFADPHSLDVINHWASDKTHGKIRRIADGMIDSTQTRLFLANAVYFKGKWLWPFAAKNTKERPFHLRGGGEKLIPMMTQTRNLPYRQGSGYQAVRLPYVGDQLAMYVFLPNTSSGPEAILDMFSGDAWQRAIKPGFRSTEGTLTLPRFTVEYSVELRQPLQSLGMKAAFDPRTADFSGIGQGLFISAARQKTFIEVNEEGTEASAVTGIGMSLTALRPRSEPFEMIVDRPFVFMIEDRPTGTILFMGVLFHPASL
jgi:serine protease inhibitor